MNKLELNEEGKKEGRGKFLTKSFRAMSAGMAILAFAGPIKDTETPKNKHTETTSFNSGKNLPIRPSSWLAPDIRKEDGEPQKIWQHPEVRRCPFLEGTDENGRPKFNVWSLIAILQAEMPYLDKVEGKITIQMPFEYTRPFTTDEKAGKPACPERQKGIEMFLDNEFNKRFGEILYGWDWSKQVYRRSQKNIPENVKIKSIEITGTVSPEELQSKEPRTIGPSTVDRESLGLAFERGRIGLSLTKEWLQKTGINLKQLEETATKIQAKEIQFSARELAELRIVSREIEGHDDLEKIYNLIKLYNNGDIKKKNVIDTLDQAVGRKRMVEITINYEGEQKRRILIPIPLLPIIIGVALPALIRAARKRSETKNKVSEINPSIRDTELPLENSLEYQDMKERTIIDDLGMFFDRKETIKRGLNYRELASDAQIIFPDFRNEKYRELYLTGEILIAWRIHDKKCRQEAGFPPENLDQGLDYENQPRQIQWAKMHARALLEIIDENHKNGKGYKEILDGIISKMLILRDDR